MSVGSVISTSNEQRFELGISPSCCRSLFGPIDHAQLRAELETELRRIAEEKKRRWNFDFVKVEPLDGDFLWQRIGESRSVGLSTSEDQVTAETHDRITPQHSSCSSMHAESNTKSSNRNTFSGQTNCFNTPEQLPVKRRRKSPRITDYLRAKKGSATSRQIKFCSDAGVPKVCRHIHTRQRNNRNRSSKQSTLEQFMPKLRPRQSNGKVQVAS